jgi:hypothetical protein
VVFIFSLPLFMRPALNPSQNNYLPLVKGELQKYNFKNMSQLTVFAKIFNFQQKGGLTTLFLIFQNLDI